MNPEFIRKDNNVIALPQAGHCDVEHSPQPGRPFNHHSDGL
jgi:hypothetical protein